MIDFRHDDVYFKLSSSQIQSKLDSKSIRSLSVVEEQGKLTTGSIILDDPASIYFDIINRGEFLDLEWGRNFSERGTSLFRKGLSVLVTSPSMKLDKTGTTTINFKSGFTAIKERVKRIYSGTRAQIISSVMSNAGVSSSFIDFTGMEESTELRQDNETDFNFLTKKSYEYKTFFRIGSDLSGNLIGIFCDYNSPLISNFSKLTTGSISDTFNLDYKSGDFNVIEASVDYNYSDSGGGKNIRFVVIDGNPIKQEYEKVPQKVQAMQLDEEKLFAYQKKLQEEQGFDAAAKFLADVYAAKDFESDIISQFWTPVDYKTATPHTGLKITAKIQGNAQLTPPVKTKFNGLWPRSVSGNNNIKIRRVDHNLSRDGYYCTVECRDYFQI